MVSTVFAHAGRSMGETNGVKRSAQSGRWVTSSSSCGARRIRFDRQHDDGAGSEGSPDPGVSAGELGAPVLGRARRGIETSPAAVRADQVDPLHAVPARGDLDAVRSEREPDRHVGGLHVPVVPVERGPARHVIDIDRRRRRIGEVDRESGALQREGGAERWQRRARLGGGRRPGFRVAVEAFEPVVVVDPASS